MITCQRCKASYAKFREHCPICGTARPLTAITERQSFKHLHESCDACQRAIAGSPEHCDYCDGLFHARCLKSHVRACEDRANMLDFEDWLSDYQS